MSFMQANSVLFLEKIKLYPVHSFYLRMTRTMTGNFLEKKWQKLGLESLQLRR